MAFGDLPTRSNGDTITAAWFNDIRTAGLESTGASSSIKWLEDAEAPFYAVENSFETYQYSSGLAQNLYGFIYVPSNFATGSQIFLKKTFYSSGTTGTALLQTSAILIRPSDTVTQENNQFTSTNAAVTLSASTVNKAQLVSFDLTNSSGQINGITVAANDYIKIRLTRGTDTSTAAIKLILPGDGVTFS